MANNIDSQDQADGMQMYTPDSDGSDDALFVSNSMPDSDAEIVNGGGIIDDDDENAGGRYSRRNRSAKRSWSPSEDSPNSVLEKAPKKQNVTTDAAAADIAPTIRKKISRKTAKAKAKISEWVYESLEQKDSILTVGHPVLAPFPGKDPPIEPTYWGRISRKQSKGDKTMYIVEFSDGDVLENEITSFYIHRLAEIHRLCKVGYILANKPPLSYYDLWDSSTDGPAPKDFFGLPIPTTTAPPAAAGPPATTPTATTPPATTSAGTLKRKETAAVGRPSDGDRLKPCGKCYQCITRAACGACAVCIDASQQSTDVSSSSVCLQKTCSKLSQKAKCRTCKHLPHGWHFYFDMESTNEDFAGLRVCKGKRKFFSFQGARSAAFKLFANLDANAFYEYVGLAALVKRSSETQRYKQLQRNYERKRSLGNNDEREISNMVPSETNNGPKIVALDKKAAEIKAAEAKKAAEIEAAEAKRTWSFAELMAGRCEECRSCKREPCGSCDSCRQSIRSRGCLRRMCVKIRDTNKAQPTEYLPPGWKFYFEANPCRQESTWQKLDGLVIMAPNRRRYNCVESAIRHNRKHFKSYQNAPEKLYEHVGIQDLESEDRLFLRRSNCDLGSHVVSASKPGRLSDQSTEIPPVVEVDDDSSSDENSVVMASSFETSLKPLTTKELYRQRCRSCVMCKRDDCGKCFSCRLNRGRSTTRKRACFHRMCATFAEKQKRQDAAGFPKGWTFCFVPLPKSAPAPYHEDLRGLIILSPKLESFKSVAEALDCFDDDQESRFSRSKIFYEHIGATLRNTIFQHRLLNRSHWQEWIRADGTKQCIGGRITLVEQDALDGQEFFTITFDEETRANINMSGLGKMNVPPSLSVGFDLAWDGCLRSFEHAKLPTRQAFSRAPSFRRWMTPNTYFRKMVKADENISGQDQKTPCVQITYKGYLLTFCAKKSTIPNSGFGVFLSVRPFIEANLGDFQLEAGELLDFGVYAPFCLDDYRKDHVHLIKSIIHSNKNEEYCFGTREEGAYFDITDDITGKLHTPAKQHIPPHVNEVCDPNKEIPTVHAEVDPEGSLHYLLGHGNEDDGPFYFPADGTEKELFIDYGDAYENVRLREGYPRKQMERSEAIAKLTQEEKEYVKEIETFSVLEIQNTYKMLDQMLLSGRQPAREVVLRMVFVSVLLKVRAKKVYEEFSDLGDDESFCDNGVRNQDLEQLVIDCTTLVCRGCKAWQDWFGTMVDFHKAAISSEIFRDAFAQVFSNEKIDDMTSQQFEDCLCKSDPEFQ